MVQFSLTHQTGTLIEHIVGFEMVAEIWSYYLVDNAAGDSATVHLHVEMSEPLEENAIGDAVSDFNASPSRTNPLTEATQVHRNKQRQIMPTAQTQTAVQSAVIACQRQEAG